MVNQARFAQAFGNLFGFFVFCLKCVDQLQANQIGQFDFDRHGAAVGDAGLAHAHSVARPSFEPVHIGVANGEFDGRGHLALVLVLRHVFENNGVGGVQNLHQIQHTRAHQSQKAANERDRHPAR